MIYEAAKTPLVTVYFDAIRVSSQNHQKQEIAIKVYQCLCFSALVTLVSIGGYYQCNKNQRKLSEYSIPSRRHRSFSI